MNPVFRKPIRNRFDVLKRRIVVAILLTLLLFLLVGTVQGLILKQAQTPKVTQEREQQGAAQPDNSLLTFSAVGDLLAHDSVVQNAKTDTGYDFYSFFSSVAPIMRKADVRFCNQEGPVAGEVFGISGYPTFNAPTEFARDANKAGCNMINLANNHVADKGLAGLSKTIEVWEDQDILAVAGANTSTEAQRQIRYFEKKEITTAFLAFAEFSNNASIEQYAVNRIDNDFMKTLVTEARSKADLVVVSMHWGTEDENTVNQKQRNAASFLAGHGVDVIIGTGPHVLQPVEKLPKGGGGETLVWYSIGNLLSTQLETKQRIGGIALFDVAKEDKEVKVVNERFVPTYMHYEWTAADKAAERLSARKNLKIYPLAQSAEPLSRSLLDTTVEDQQRYVRHVLGTVPEIIDSL